MRNFDFLKDKKVLVTGGAGFIAFHLTRQLLQLGAQVTSLDNFDPFYARTLKETNVSDLQKICKEVRSAHPGARFDFHEMDLCEPQNLESLPKNFDLVVHLAAKAGVRPSLLDPAGYIRANLTATAILLEWMRSHNLQKIAFGSSSSVYGNDSAPPFREDMRCDLPISHYAATKRSGELLCHSYSHLYAMQVACLRFFTVYGPRQRPDLVIRKFVDAISKSEKITLYGDGSTSRDYTFVEDIVSGILGTLEHLNRAQSSHYEIFNLGNSSPISLMEMLNTIETSLGLKADIQWEKLQPGDVHMTCADISKAKAALNYKPQTSFAKGIDQVVTWYRSL